MENGREKEIDLLLRASARRARALTPQSGTESAMEPVSAHLDADELIAFAEHALPAAARSRYTAHLADCDLCRKVLSGLGVESPVEDTKNSKAALPASPGLIEKLLSALRFPAVRYGLPVAAVVVILTTVLLTAIRSDRRGTVALIEKQTATSAPQSNDQGAAEGTVSNSTIASQNDAAKATLPKPEGSAAGKQPLTTAQDAAGPATASTEKEEPKQPLPAEATSSELREQERNREAWSNTGLDKNETAKAGRLSARSEPEAPPPPPATAPQAKPAPEDRSSDDMLVTRDAARGGIGGARKDANQPSLAQSRARAPSAAAGANSAVEEDEKSVDKLSTRTEREKRSEFRAVGGKQFRRVDGEWVDSAFNGSNTVDVKRGSEQYRALLADEPGLRPYAEQLSGRVTVVWKGRSYRFH